MEEPYSTREIKTLIETVNQMKKDIKAHTESVNEYIKSDGIAHVKIMTEVKGMKEDVNKNTTFREKTVNAIVGTAFLALVALGVALLKITGIFNLPK